MEFKPLEHIRIVTNEKEERAADALLNKGEVRHGLVCSTCNSTRFVVEAWIKARVEVLNEADIAAITGITHETIYVNKILECAICRTKTTEVISIK